MTYYARARAKGKLALRGNQLDWSFKDGEIRGKRLVPEAQKPSTGKLVKETQTGLLVWSGDVGQGDADAARVDLDESGRRTAYRRPQKRRRN